MYTPHTHCRACGHAKSGANGIKAAPADKLLEAFDLGVQPLANDFCKADQPRAGYAPLKVMFCPRCTLAQLSVVVRPDILYSHYSYITSASQMMKLHFDQLWADMQAECKLKSVVEIGSNTGDFLEFCMKMGANRVLGIDPAENLCEIACQKGIQSIAKPFSFHTAIMAHSRMMGVDAVVARHVFCHIDNWHDFILNLREIGDIETIYCIEVPYALNMLADCSFDTVYHEHLSYLTIKSVKALLKDTGLHIHNVQKYPIHGGAIVITLRDDKSKVSPMAELPEMSSEKATLVEWTAFAANARDQICRLRATVESLVAQGKRVAGLGASAKSTVWINACGFTRKQIAFISDNTPQKQYTFSPGTDIPIVDEGAILRDLPDYVVMFAWNYKAEVLEKFALARSKGVKFIVPIPKIEIV